MNEEHSSRRNGGQMAGDKSGERSIVSSVMEEEDDDNASDSTSSANITNDDDITYNTHTIQEDEEMEDDESQATNGVGRNHENDVEAESDVDDDDDLSETVYDENDQSTTYRSQYGGTSLGPFSEDEGIDEDDSLLFEDSTSIQHIASNRNNRDNHRHSTLHENQIDDDDADTIDNNSTASLLHNHNDDNSQDSNNGEIDEDDDEEHDEEEENDDDDATNPNNTSDNSGDPNPYLEEADQLLQDLLIQYDDVIPTPQSQLNHNNPTNPQAVPIEEYKDALEQLSSKWEQIHEQINYYHCQQIDTIVTERNELEIAIDELQRNHRDEIDSTKQQVMEQSQRITCGRWIIGRLEDTILQ